VRAGLHCPPWSKSNFRQSFATSQGNAYLSFGGAGTDFSSIATVFPVRCSPKISIAIVSSLLSASVLNRLSFSGLPLCRQTQPRALSVGQASYQAPTEIRFHLSADSPIRRSIRSLQVKSSRRKSFETYGLRRSTGSPQGQGASGQYPKCLYLQ